MPTRFFSGFASVQSSFDRSYSSVRCFASSRAKNGIDSRSPVDQAEVQEVAADADALHALLDRLVLLLGERLGVDHRQAHVASGRALELAQEAQDAVGVLEEVRDVLR
jgi:hypothetical protein